MARIVFRMISSRTAVAVLVGLVGLASAGRVDAQSLPAVHVIGTGGTIGSGGDYWHGRSTRIPIDQIVRVPGIETLASITSEQLWNVGSTSIGPARWLELSRHVTDVFRAQPSLSGIVITHGTDTMEE